METLLFQAILIVGANLALCVLVYGLFIDNTQIK